MINLILWTCLTFCCFSSNAHALDIMLPRVYHDDMHVVGWLMSEKLDGVRGYWDGKYLLSKNGNRLYPPELFTRGLPPFPLEGELWGGRGTFSQTVSIVKKQYPHDGWLKLQFAIFDVPQDAAIFTQRLSKAQAWFAEHPSRFAFVIPQTIIKDKEELKAELKKVEELGGEGLIIRRPDTLYAKGRSSEILKIKNYFDTEAVVIAHIQGQGKNRGRMGSLLVELLNKPKTRFKIGTGFNDAEREAPPAIGTVITFKYYGLYPSGIPKFPSFLRIRIDATL